MFALAVVGVLLSVLVATVVLVGCVAASHRARTAADLAALAAASSVDLGEPSCSEAQRVAAAHGATLRKCAVDGPFVEVEAVVLPAGPASRFGQARARARAGPDEGPARDGTREVSGDARTDP